MEVLEILNYPLNLLNFCGCFVPLTSDMTHLGDGRLPPRYGLTRNIAMTSYRAFLVLLHTANCLRCFAFEVYFLQHFNSRLAFYFQWNLLVIFGILVYVLESILCRFYLKPVLTGLKNYGTIFGYKNNLNRTKKFIRIVSYISLFGVFILTVVTNSVHMFWTHDEKPFFIYPFHDKEGLEFFLGGYLVTAITPFSYLTICGFFILYSVIVEIVSNEFVGSRAEMDHALNTFESLQETEAAFLRARYGHLVFVFAGLIQVPRNSKI